MSQRSIARLRPLLVLLFCLGLGLATAGTAATQGVATATRILVADGDTGELRVVDAESGEVIATFSTPGGSFVPVYHTESGRYFVAHHYDGNQVTIVDSGIDLEDHGDHADLVVSDPFVLATVTTGKAPAHWWTHDGILAVYNDGDGTVSLFAEDALSTAPVPETIPAGEPDHAAFVVIDDVLVVASYDGGTVDAYQLDGSPLATDVQSCPSAHGEWVFGNSVVFGCTDGLAVITVTGQELTSHKIANPESGAATPTGGAEEAPHVSTIVGHPEAELLIGNYGEGLALIEADFRGGAITPMALPAAPVGMVFDESGERVLVLTDDGSVHAVDPAAAEIIWTAEDVVTPYAELSADGSFSFYPGIDVSGDLLYLPNPETGELVTLEIAGGKLAGTIDVGGAPARLTIISATGAGH